MEKDYQTRNFNELKLIKNKNGLSVLKKSIYKDKFYNEIRWLVSIPRDLKKYVPLIQKYSLDKDNLFLKYSYINCCSLHDCLIKSIFHTKTLTSRDIHFYTSLSKSLNKLLIDFSKYRPKKINKNEWDNNLHAFYVLKSINRISGINHHKFDYFFNKKYIKINGKKYPSLTSILSFLKKVSINREPNLSEQFCKILTNYDNRICITHGDLTFSNIFFNNSTKKITLIDPRGSFGSSLEYGDSFTDYAKIYQTIYGNYDLIISNIFKLNFNNNDIIFSFPKNKNLTSIRKIFDKHLFADASKKATFKLIFSLMYLTMIPFHEENELHQILFLCIGIISFYECTKSLWKF